jgi:hypothetical protein
VGRSVFPNGYISDDPVGIDLVLNGPLMKLALERFGDDFINRAISLFESVSKHDDMAPILYPARFGIRDSRHLTVESIEIFNDDPTAEWVEFGAHADGKTGILKYRIFGRTADAFEAEAG